MSIRRALATAMLLVSSVAHADGPAVDVADLPPLPAAEDEVSSSATLLAAAAAEEDVVVGAAKREQTLGNVASAVTVVTSDRIRRFGYRTVAEALAGVAGVYFQDTRLTQQIGIRGVQVPGGFNSRILVLVDGATVNELWGAFAGVGWDALVSIDEIARIEVIRGPVGAVYGTNAFFGIINIVTRGAVEGSRAWGRVGLHSIQGAVTTAGFAVGGVDRQLRGSVLAASRFGETYSVPEISGRDLDSDGGTSFVASLVARSGGTFAQLRAMRSRRDSAFAPYDSDPAADPSYALYNNQVLLEGGHTRELSDHLTGTARAYGGAYRYRDRIVYSDDDPFNDYGDALTFGGETRARYEAIEGKLGVTAGLEANYNRTESRAYTDGMEADGATVPLDFWNQSAYSELDGQPLPWLGFTGGVRYDRNTAISQRVSPRGALFLAKPEKYGLKLLYAEGFRNPSAFEGFFEDRVDFSANPDIEPETIRSFEAVVWARPTFGLSTRVSGFYWDAREVIEQRPDPSDDTLLQFQNVGRYVTAGVEAEASYRTSGGWYAFGGGAYARVGSAERGAELAYGHVVNAPALTLSGGLSTPRLGGYAHLSAEALFVSRRATRPTEDGTAGPTSPPWTGINLTVYVPNLRGFDVTAGVRNLIGRRDRVPAPGDYDRFPAMMDPVTVHRIPGEGRELFVKVGYSY